MSLEGGEGRGGGGREGRGGERGMEGGREGGREGGMHVIHILICSLIQSTSRRT